MKNEITVTGLSIPTVEIAETAMTRRDEILLRSQRVLLVRNADEQKVAVEAMAEIKSLLNGVEASREMVKRPVLEIGRKIDGIAKDFSADLLAETKRLSAIVSIFQREEIERAEKVRREQELARIRAIEEEERKQAELMAKAAAAKTSAARNKAFEAMEAATEKRDLTIAATIKKESESGPARVAGMVVKKTWKFEVLDIKEVFKSRPDCVTLEPNNMVIRGMIGAGMRECPGLRIYEDTTTSVRGA